MEHSIFEDKDLHDQPTALMLLESHRYWSKKRLIFNIIVGIAGLASTITFSQLHLTLFDLCGMIAWDVVANGLYSFGFLWESIIITRSKGVRNLNTNRGFLFWAGTGAYVLVSILFAFQYFLIVQ